MANVASIDLAIRGGKYQALAPYTIHYEVSSSHHIIPASTENGVTRSAVGQLLEAVGFVREGGGYVSVAHAAQARICVSGSGPDATIGVEIWDEPNAAELLGQVVGKDGESEETVPPDSLYDSESNAYVSADDLGVSDEEYESAIRESVASSQVEGHVSVAGRRVYAQ